jgi:hypothetical protein
MFVVIAATYPRRQNSLNDFSECTMNGLGSLSWLERTGGKLAWHDRLVMVAQGVIARAARRKRERLGIKLRHIEVAKILPPESAITREAITICQDAGAPFLFHHCLRAYFWARLLDDGALAYDDEAVFTALMLHDLGLTDRHRLRGNTDQCFCIVGVRKADELAAKHCWPANRAMVTAEAIALHLNVALDPKYGKEAQLVRAGAAADVAGLGLDVLHADQIDSVVARYPRHQMKREMLRTISIESDARAACRLAFLQNQMGFAQLIRGASMFNE